MFRSSRSDLLHLQVLDAPRHHRVLRRTLQLCLRARPCPPHLWPWRRSTRPPELQRPCHTRLLASLRPHHARPLESLRSCHARPQAPAPSTASGALAAPGQFRLTRRLPPAPAVPSLPKGAVPITPVVNQHSMATRGTSGFRQPTTLHVVTVSPIPKMYRSALAIRIGALPWKMSTLISNKTWEPVPRPPGANVVAGKWIFHVKYHADGSLD
jgi:hypothetical protein